MGLIHNAIGNVIFVKSDMLLLQQQGQKSIYKRNMVLA